MICEFGDVAIVPFPFVDIAVTKYRPSLVISNSNFNTENGNSVLAMITTAQRSGWASDLSISDPAAAGLTEASFVRWKIFTLPNELIRRTAGQLGDKDQRAARTALRKIIAP